MSVYGLSLRPLGFLLSTSLFLMAGFLLLGERRPTWLIGVAVLVTVGFWALMSLGLGVFLSPWPM
jgi:putative tricarboxylic transport membrane protein